MYSQFAVSWTFEKGKLGVTRQILRPKNKVWIELGIITVEGSIVGCSNIWIVVGICRQLYVHILSSLYNIWNMLVCNTYQYDVMNTSSNIGTNHYPNRAMPFSKTTKFSSLSHPMYHFLLPQFFSFHNHLEINLYSD